MIFRLFVIVGVVWILEIIYYICTVNHFNREWASITDYITDSQGIILFVITVLKKNVLKALAER